jgi:hypothetical protein
MTRHETVDVRTIAGLSGFSSGENARSPPIAGSGRPPPRRALTPIGRGQAAPSQGAPDHHAIMEGRGEARAGANAHPARLTDVYPAARDKVELAACVGASPTSSSFTNNLGRLRTLGLIDYPSPGLARADDRLFP